MPCSRRELLTASAALPALDPGRAVAQPSSRTVTAQLLALSQASNAALMQGDLKAYQKLVRFTSDFTLMSPFGGAPTHAVQITQESMERTARFFRNGDLRVELVQAWVSADLAALAYIERSHVEVGGLPAQEWALRVTLVYRREGETWLLAHRHADPLAGGISLQEAASISARPVP